MELESISLRLQIFASNNSAIFCDEAGLPLTTKSRNLFKFSEESSNFAANRLVKKVSTKAVSKESWMFLRPSVEAHDVIASTEKNQRIVKRKWRAFKEV